MFTHSGMGLGRVDFVNSVQDDPAREGPTLDLLLTGISVPEEFQMANVYCYLRWVARRRLWKWWISYWRGY